MYAQPLIQPIWGSIGFYFLHVLDWVEFRVLPTQPMHTPINKVLRRFLKKKIVLTLDKKASKILIYALYVCVCVCVCLCI